MRRRRLLLSWLSRLPDTLSLNLVHLLVWWNERGRTKRKIALNENI